METNSRKPEIITTLAQFLRTSMPGETIVIDGAKVERISQLKISISSDGHDATIWELENRDQEEHSADTLLAEARATIRNALHAVPERAEYLVKLFDAWVTVQRLEPVIGLLDSSHGLETFIRDDKGRLEFYDAWEALERLVDPTFTLKTE